MDSILFREHGHGESGEKKRFSVPYDHRSLRNICLKHHFTNVFARTLELLYSLGPRFIYIEVP